MEKVDSEKILALIVNRASVDRIAHAILSRKGDVLVMYFLIIVLAKWDWLYINRALISKETNKY